ncbi:MULTISPECIES: hypothetical protein [unclassified Pseudomonas]|uniref:hypothetical protein n=1 Tax=unclassified Pseudomonas TaxID=196821 RepID=UPI001304F632|nr:MULTISPECIES: hypothetical protein [unclassified Pseudomonas]
MAAKLKLRRENPNLVPWSPAYLFGRSSALFGKSATLLSLSGISSVFAKTA